MLSIAKPKCYRQQQLTTHTPSNNLHKKNQILWLRHREIEKREWEWRERERERESYRGCRRWRFPWDRSAISSGNLAWASSSRPYPPLLRKKRSKNPKSVKGIDRKINYVNRSDFIFFFTRKPLKLKLKTWLSSSSPSLTLLSLSLSLFFNFIFSTKKLQNQITFFE